MDRRLPSNSLSLREYESPDPLPPHPVFPPNNVKDLNRFFIKLQHASIDIIYATAYGFINISCALARFEVVDRLRLNLEIGIDQHISISDGYDYLPHGLHSNSYNGIHNRSLIRRIAFSFSSTCGIRKETSPSLRMYRATEATERAKDANSSHR